MSVEWQQIGPQLTEAFCDPKRRVHRTSKERVQGKYPEGTRGLLVAYVDARQVFSRLDELFGPEGWQTSYGVLDTESGAVECTLTIEGISKSDVGYPNRSGDEEPLKAAYSDATKRAAVQWGIGRWLYEEEPQWVEIDQHGRALAQTTTHPLELEALPAMETASAGASSRDHGNGFNNGDGEATPKQLAFIERLCAAKGEEVAAWPAHSKQEASDAISSLMALPEPRAAA
ncbi:MAG: hypothetical protein CL878_11470 [Dehalococcoidia bacterium]|nr:hypothetical protein [Dehalococcoidia bacterium]